MLSHLQSSDNSADSTVASKSRIVMVCLNTHKKSIHWNNFKKKSFDEKLKIFVGRISSLCAHLSGTEPNAMWIFIWRENGIFDSVSDDDFVSNVQKSNLKKAMAELTLKYPQLVLIGGVSSVKKIKECNRQEKLNELFEIYRYHTKLASDNSVTKNFWRQHFNQVSAADNSFKEIEILRNTVYLFQNGKVEKHDKILPFSETTKYRSSTNFRLFQPANLTKAKNTFEFIHPDSKKTVTINLEICYEHYCGVLKKQNASQALIHLILSDSVNVVSQNINGNFLVQADSQNTPYLYYQKLASEEGFDINLFENYLMEASNEQLCPRTAIGLAS